MKREWIDTLLELQETDMRIRRLKVRLEIIPEEKKKMKQDVEQDKTRLHDTKEEVMKSEMKIKQIESDIKEQNEIIQRLQNQSLSIKKNDEYQAMTKEIDHHKQKISDLETDEIMLLDELEDAKNRYKTVEKNCELKDKSVNDEIKEMDDLEKDIHAEINKMSELRIEQSKNIEESLLDIYNLLLKRGKGTPFVQVQKGNCGNCHLKLTPQTITQTLKHAQVKCENCGHLLYSEKD